MMKHLRFVLLVVLFTSLMSVLPVAAQDDEVTLQLAWWGGDQRAAMYNKIADLYEELNPNVTIEREFAGFDAYFERLATQVAGGNPPDVLHMHQFRVAGFVDRSAMLDLTPLVDAGTIDLSKFAPGIVDTGRVDGKIYMVTLGNSAPGTHYNARLLEETDVEAPTYEWTWDDFVALATELAGKLPEGVYASADTANSFDIAFEPYVRQRGYKLFEGEAIGFPKEVLVDWWTIWQTLREAGALPPIELTVERMADGVENNVLVTGDAALMMLSGNQHRLYQQNTEDELGLTSIPRANDPEGRFGDVVGGAYIGLSASTEHVEEAAAFLNWFVNSEEAARIFNGEHGPVGNAEMQALIADQQQPADKRLADLMAFYAQDVMNPDVRPSAAAEVAAAYQRFYQELAFGNYGSVEEAVDAFFDEAEFILE
ncbi:MAG: carbohydrate ABC transporter substrate-binding protein [Anaerolineae bacterium]|nr:carbohydrate ABC transporter substrate-binding protein [Anaerolineae bacterium]